MGPIDDRQPRDDQYCPVRALDWRQPDIIGGITLVSLAAYNGVEIADYQALTQAIAEQTSERSDETGSEE